MPDKKVWKSDGDHPKVGVVTAGDDEAADGQRHAVVLAGDKIGDLGLLVFIHVPTKVGLIPDEMLPKSALPETALTPLDTATVP